MSDDWKIGDDRRRRTTDQIRAFQKANEGEVAWDTLAPADFTYVFHPDRVLVDGDDVEGFEELVGAARRPGPHGRAAPRRRRAARRRRGALRAARAPGRTVGAGGARPPRGQRPATRGRVARPLGARVPRRRRQTCARPSSRRRPASPSRGRRRRPRPGARAVRSVSSSSTRAGTRPPRPTPAPRGSQGVKGDDELNGPDLRPYAGHGTFIAGVVRCVAPETRVYVEGFAIGGVGGGGILESDLVVQLEQALRHDPQVINLSAGCRTRRDRPSIPLRKFHRRHLDERDCVLVAAAGNDSWAAPFWPAAFDWCVGVGSLDRDGRVSVVLQLRGLRRRLRAGPQPGQRVPRRDVRVQRDAGQGRRPGLQHRHGAVERHVVLGAGRGRPHRPRDRGDGRVGTRRVRRRPGPRDATTPTR